MRFNLIVISAASGIVFDNVDGASQASIDTSDCLDDRLAFELLEMKNIAHEEIKSKYYKEISDEAGYLAAGDRLFEIFYSPELSESEYLEKEALEEMIFDWYQRGISIPPEARSHINSLIEALNETSDDCGQKLATVIGHTRTIADHMGTTPDRSLMKSLQTLHLSARLKRPGKPYMTPRECNGPRLNPAQHHPDMSAWNTVLKGVHDTFACLGETLRVKAAFEKAYYKKLVYDDEMFCTITRFRQLTPLSRSRTDIWEWGILEEMIKDSNIRVSINDHSELARRYFVSLEKALKDIPARMTLEACKDKVAEVQELAMKVAIHANHKPLKSQKAYEEAMMSFPLLEQKSQTRGHLTLMEVVQLKATKMMTEEYISLMTSLNKWMETSSGK